MQDKAFPFSVSQVTAAICLLIGTCLVVANFFHAHTHDHLGFLGMPFLAFGILARVRSYLCQQSKLIREAFDAGREVGRRENLYSV